MNFGANIYNWLSGNIQQLVLVAIILIAIVLFVERKISKVAGLVVLGIVAIGFVYNTTGVKDLFLQLFNMAFN